MAKANLMTLSTKRAGVRGWLAPRLWYTRPGSAASVWRWQAYYRSPWRSIDESI